MTIGPRLCVMPVTLMSELKKNPRISGVFEILTAHGFGPIYDMAILRLGPHGPDYAGRNARYPHFYNIHAHYLYQYGL